MHNTLMLSTFVASSLLSRNAYAFRSAQLQRRCVGALTRMHMSDATTSISDDGIDATRTNEEQQQQQQQQQQTETWQNPRSRWARKKHKKRIREAEEEEAAQLQQQQKQNNGDSVALDWESFEFGESPKMDGRFDDSNTSPSNQTGIPDSVLNTISTDSITYKTYVKSESNLDDTISQQSLQTQAEIQSLDPDIVQRSIDILAPYIQERRLERINEVLNHRTRHTRFLFENPSNPSNVWACLRTLDSFGIQYVDVIVHSESYQGKAAVNQKRGMRTAMGSAMWMTIRQFGSLESAIRTLRDEEGCLIYASDLNPTAKDVRDLTWDVDLDTTDTTADTVDGSGSKRDQKPVCIVMGNEDCGISDEMRELADETFYLPMSGFAESFNLSVATAITLAYMSAVSGRGDECDTTANSNDCKGPLRPGDLDLHEMECLKLKGVLNSLANKRLGPTLLKKEGIILPKSLYNN